MSQMVQIRFPEELLAAVDRVRGLVPRSAWIKQLCLDAVAAADALDAATAAPGVMGTAALSEAEFDGAVADVASVAARARGFR